MSSAPVPVVGFDLDMTLVDSRERIVTCLSATLAAHGAPVDDGAIWRCIGLPLETALGRLAPAHDVTALAREYRARHDAPDAPPVAVLPGAAEALRAVRDAGGRTLVVSAKVQPALEKLLADTALAPLVDEAVGGRYGPQKGEVLRDRGATAYVGDHPGDVVAARTGAAASVAVATGPHTAAELAAGGPDVLLDHLHAFPGWLDEHVLDLRLAALDARLRELGSVLVAFSGGADSALLLAAAVRALGPDRVAAATAVSGSLASGELDDARRLADELGVRLLTPATREIEREGYRANAGDRCYFCKAELLDVLRPFAAEHGLAHVATGTNADDAVAGFRPGIRAAAERGAVTPLLDAGLTKAQVRAASRRWGLRTSDKPAAACLSSRIAYGVPITPRRLARVDRAEAALRRVLRDAGIAVSDLRVRDLGENRARVEVDAARVEDVAGLREAGRAVLDAGFDDVHVDPRGFRSGSMNELLADPARYR
ncbi:MAG: ATP-dependent sacrificial sulfur transferase LarE [Actinomycetota bacterium]